MNISIFYAVLIFVGVCVGIALAWFLIELVVTLRKTRKKVDQIHKQLTPTIDNIEQITTKIQPAIDKIDPLVERVSLTVDAANLELMRADQILENVNVITEGAANATTAVGDIVNAPAELINKAGKKITGLISGGEKYQDDLSMLGEADNIDQVVNESKKQRRIFGRKVNRPQHQAVAGETTNLNNPYINYGN